MAQYPSMWLPVRFGYKITNSSILTKMGEEETIRIYKENCDEIISYTGTELFSQYGSVSRHFFYKEFVAVWISCVFFADVNLSTLVVYRLCFWYCRTFIWQGKM